MKLNRTPLVIEAIHYRKPVDAIDAAAEHARRLNMPVTIYTHKRGMDKGVAIGVHGPSERETAFSHPGRKDWRTFARIGATGKVMQFKPDMVSPITPADIEHRVQQTTAGLQAGRRWKKKGALTPRRQDFERRLAAYKATKPPADGKQQVPTIRAATKVGLLNRFADMLKSVGRRIIGEAAAGTKKYGPVAARGSNRLPAMLRRRRGLGILGLARKPFEQSVRVSGIRYNPLFHDPEDLAKAYHISGWPERIKVSLLRLYGSGIRPGAMQSGAKSYKYGHS